MKHSKFDYLENYSRKCGIKNEIVSKTNFLQDKNLVDEYLNDNHKKYMVEPLRIGFTEQFPENEKEIIDKILINEIYDGVRVSFNVRYGKVTFGDNNKYSCEGITTDRLELPRKGPLNGWGQHTYSEESKLMQKAVVVMAKKHGLMICTKICSWPFAKVIVQKLDESHIRYFKEEKNK